MNRVIVTRPVVGVCHMQVCAVADATDDEILGVCNRDNRSGTSLGWTAVCRASDGDTAPVACQDDPQRVHLLVSC